MYKIFFLPLIFTILSSCNTKQKATSETKINNENLVLSDSYHVTKLYGEDVSEHEITLVFDALKKQISGFSGCNNYSASFSQQQHTLDIKMHFSTKRYCTTTGNLERKFFGTFSKITEYRLDNNVLILDSDDTKNIIEAKIQ